MPPTLHPYLKRGLDFDASPVHPSDRVEELQTDRHDDEFLLAKRRRVEAIASQYLRGKPPLILTACLKGPFTKQWRNPWATDGQVRADGRNSEGFKVQEEKQRTKLSKATPVASPEASRAVGPPEEYLYSQAELEPLPATAPFPDGEDLSGASVYFSIDTEQLVSHNSPANPFWLRRPAASITFPPNSQTDKSPTRLRKNDHRSNARGSLQLAPPKEPLGARPLPTCATPSAVWRSEASASMDISSLAGPVESTSNTEQNPRNTTPSTDLPDSSRLRADSAQEDEARSSQAAQHAELSLAATTPTGSSRTCNAEYSEASTMQPIHAQSFDSLVPATTYKLPSTIQVPRSSPLNGPAGARSTIKSSKQIDHSAAERLPCPAHDSIVEAQQLPTKCKSTRGTNAAKEPRHNLVASPAPDSSTGFMYRKVTQSKGEGSNISRSKPRTVSFSTSPTNKKKDPGQPCAASEENIPAALQRSPSCTEPVASRETLDAAGSETNAKELDKALEEDRDEDEQQDSHKSKQSQYSTQAAMLLAQLVFQGESTQSSTLSSTLRPWSQPAQNTPPPLSPQPSPAITPLSVFDAHRDDSQSVLAEDSALHGPSISTQDLFDAASPFAFSTVKRKSEWPRRTSLRFALASNSSGNILAKCPTPSTGRVPLKEKNTPTVWSFMHDKTSSNETKKASHSPRHTALDIELPKLDFNTSLDFCPNTDFTGCFLKGMDEEP